MKLTLISLCLGAAIVPGIAMAATAGTPPVSTPDITTGFTSTNEDGTLTQTLSFSGEIFNAKTNWAWKLGDKTLTSTEGTNILELDSSAFVDGSVTVGALGDDALVATVTPTAQIPILTGMTKRTYQSGGLNTLPKVEIKEVGGSYKEIGPYNDQVQKVTITVNGQKPSGSVTGNATIYLPTLFGYTSKTENNVGYLAASRDFNEKSSDYSAWAAKYTTSIQDVSKGWFFGAYLKPYMANTTQKEISAYWQTNLSKAEIAWKKNEVPETWAMPIEVKITMI